MKLSLVAATAAAALVGSALAIGQNPAGTTTAPAPAPGGSELKDLKSKVSYGLGLNMGKNFKAQSIDIDPELVFKGLKDAMGGGKALLTDVEIGEAMKAFQQQIQSQMADNVRKKAESSKQEGAAYLAANAKKPGVKTLPSGLQYRVEREGTGASPKATDMVTVHYEGRLIDGTPFDSSYKRGEPAKFPVNGVIAGWTEALQLMKVGSKWQLTIPSELAYKDTPRPGGQIPPNATLIFDVELLGIGGAQ